MTYPAWDDKVIARFLKRVGMFNRRGWPTYRAEAFADMLARRDHDKDDRRACIECVHLQRGGRCDAGQSLVALPFDALQRCPSFNWLTA
jgi:hypothetical protein